MTVRFGLNVSWEWRHVVLSVGALVALRCRVDLLWVVLAGAVLSAALFSPF